MGSVRRALFSDAPWTRPRVPGAMRKWRLIERAGAIEALLPSHRALAKQPRSGLRQGPPRLWVQRAGISMDATRRLVDATTLHGNVPEPVRIAHLIAGGVVHPGGAAGGLDDPPRQPHEVVRSHAVSPWCLPLGGHVRAQFLFAGSRLRARQARRWRSRAARRRGGRPRRGGLRRQGDGGAPLGARRQAEGRRLLLSEGCDPRLHDGSLRVPRRVGPLHPGGGGPSSASRRTPPSRTAFLQDKNLPFALASDESGTVGAAYGVPKRLRGYSRVTFLVGLDGRSRTSGRTSTGVHADEVLQAEPLRRPRVRRRDPLRLA